MDLNSALGTVILFSTVLAALSAFAERITDIIKEDALGLGIEFFKKDLTLLTGAAAPQAPVAADVSGALDAERNRGARIQVMSLIVCLAVAHLLGVDATDVFRNEFKLVLNPSWANLGDGGIWITGLLMSRGSKYWHSVVNVVNDLRTAEGDLRRKLAG